MSTNNGFCKMLLLAVIALALGACASGGATKSAAHDSARAKKEAARIIEDVEKSAVTRWQLIIDGHADKAYDFLSPGARSAKSREVWAREISERPIKWKSVSYLDKACETDDSCQVRLQVEYTAPVQGIPGGVVGAPGYLTEQWVKIDKIWYFIPGELVSGGLH